MYSGDTTFLCFRKLLELVDIDPATTLIARHTPVEKELRQILPALVVDRPDLFLAYQRIQWNTLEKAMTRGRHIAAFIGEERQGATFAGIYRIDGWEELDFAGYRDFPGNSELEELGMSGRKDDMAPCLAFNLERLDHYVDWIGRLAITWPLPFQSWWRWARTGSFPVTAIERENRFVRTMPEWEELVLGWSQLRQLPRSWEERLSQWAGIYYIYDSTRRAGYVGSACGQENILGRWRNYADTGHGGNKDLRGSNAADLKFSILQRTSPDIAPDAIVALENRWKERLHTRAFGLNRN